MFFKGVTLDRLTRLQWMNLHQRTSGYKCLNGEGHDGIHEVHGELGEHGWGSMSPFD